MADSVFAELRRQGVVGAGNRGRQQAGSGDPPAPAGAAPAAPGSNDIGRLRALDRALNTTGHAQRLNDAAYARLEREYLAESPEDARAWVSSYFEGFGVSPQAPAAAPSPAAGPASPAATAQPSQPAGPPATTPQPTNQRPASDAGGPPAPSPHIEDLDLLSATPAQRNELVRTKGLKWFNDRLHAQMRDKRFQLR